MSDSLVFFRAALRALIRAEQSGRVPARFSGAGRDVWQTFHNELTIADLVALCIEDAGATMPIPFSPSIWWPGWPDQARLQLKPHEVEQWVEEDRTNGNQPLDAYLRSQAAFLGFEPPPEQSLTALSTPARHEHWLELPGTGGWLAYALSTRPGAGLYYWENFSIVCSTPQEMLLAGLIAWELNAPPRAKLSIYRDDPDLTATLKAGTTYHGVFGRRELHGHRDLRVLHHEAKGPTWL